MLYKKIFLFALGIISILIGFFYSENSSGGAIHDSNYLLPFIQAFGNDLNEGFKLFWSNSGSLVHSPIFYIFSGKILDETKINESIFNYKLWNINSSNFDYR